MTVIDSRDMPATLAQRMGLWLFALRSFTPVPVVAIALALLWRSRGAYGPGGAAADRALDAVGILTALSGQALRVAVLGRVPEGTSGQGATLEAAVLNTRGPYARVRNPLYAGNFLLVLGLLCVAHDPWLYGLGLGFFAIQYAFIVHAEEAFLRERFGAEFDAYAARVPRWVPGLRPATGEPLSSRFDRRRALFKEHNPFAAWASGVVALLAWEAWWRARATPWTELWLLAGVEVAIISLFVGAKGWKRGWFRRRGATRP